MKELLQSNFEWQFTCMKFIERRRCKRHALNGTSRVLPDMALAAVTYQAIDVSLCGVGIVGTRPIECNSTCMVSFDLVYEGEQKRINAHGTVVASTPTESGHYRIGIRFADMDSRSREILETLESDCRRPVLCYGGPSKIRA